MTKSMMLALASGLVAATTAFAPVASAGYGHGHGYRTYYQPYYSFGYSYRPYRYYAPACKWVSHYGHYKKVCW